MVMSVGVIQLQITRHDYDSSVLALENRFILNLLANLSQTIRLIVQKKNQIIKDITLRTRFCY